MIWCVRKKRKKRRIFLLILISLAVVIFLVSAKCIRPTVRSVTQEEIRALTVDLINSSVSEVMDGSVYLKLINTVKDEEGNIALIETDSSAVNSLVRAITTKAQEKLSGIEQDGVGIPLGTLCGITFLAGRGPLVQIKAMPIGNVSTDFLSEFTPAGINQTIHKLILDVSATVSIILPGAENKVKVSTQVMIGESIIIGKVPNVYFENQSKISADSASTLYDLVP